MVRLWKTVSIGISRLAKPGAIPGAFSRNTLFIYKLHENHNHKDFRPWKVGCSILGSATMLGKLWLSEGIR